MTYKSNKRIYSMTMEQINPAMKELSVETFHNNMVIS